MQNEQYSGRAAAFTMLLMLGWPAATAVAAEPSACVTELKNSYGANPALRSECAGPTDCTFGMVEATPAALELIAAIKTRAEACIKDSGLAYAYDDRIPTGNTLFYEGSGAKEQCALLFDNGDGSVPQRVRVACRPAD